MKVVGETNKQVNVLKINTRKRLGLRCFWWVNLKKEQLANIWKNWYGRLRSLKVIGSKH